MDLVLGELTFCPKENLFSVQSSHCVFDTNDSTAYAVEKLKHKTKPLTPKRNKSAKVRHVYRFPLKNTFNIWVVLIQTGEMPCAYDVFFLDLKLRARHG